MAMTAGKEKRIIIRDLPYSDYLYFSYAFHYHSVCHILYHKDIEMLRKY